MQQISPSVVQRYELLIVAPQDKLPKSRIFPLETDDENIVGCTSKNKNVYIQLPDPSVPERAIELSWQNSLSGWRMRHFCKNMSINIIRDGKTETMDACSPTEAFREARAPLKSDHLIQVGIFTLKIAAIQDKSVKQGTAPASTTLMASVAAVDHVKLLRQSAEKDKYLIPWAHITVGAEIGRGHYGLVFEGTWNGPEVVLKCCNVAQSSRAHVEEFAKEIYTMRGISHPNIVQLLGTTFETPEKPYMVLERMDGSLEQLVRRNDLTQEACILIARQIAWAMTFLAEGRDPAVIHRDLALRNCLYRSCATGYLIKIADFGLGRELMFAEFENSTLRLKGKGEELPVYTRAPEMLRDKIATTSTDIWAFGCLFYELLHKKVAFAFSDKPNLSNPDRLALILGGFREQIDESRCSQNLATLIRDCWQLDPKQRPKFSVIASRCTSLIAPSSPSLSQSNVSSPSVGATYVDAAITSSGALGTYV